MISQTKYRMHLSDIPTTRVEFNAVLMNSLKTWLSKRNLILIVKIPYKPIGYNKICSKFWGIIPPSEESVLKPQTVSTKFKDQNMVMIMLVDRDQLLVAPATKNAHTSEYEELNSYSSDSDSLTDQMSKHLSETLSSSFGNATIYNPWIFNGGLLDSEFMHLQQPITQKSQYQPSIPQNQAPLDTSSAVYPAAISYDTQSSAIIPATTRFINASHSVRTISPITFFSLP